MSSKTVQGIRPNIELNADQRAAMALVTNSRHKYILLYGPSRSGKSFFILYLIILRALRAPGSRHGIFRATRNSCETTLFKLTLPSVFEKVFPGLREQCDIGLSSMTVTLPNGSVLLFDGLDEQREDKVLGNEFNTAWINECNDDELTYNLVSKVDSRLSAQTATIDGGRLANKFFFDCNPKFYSDWEYKAFKQHVNPDDGDAMGDPHEWVSCKLNTRANIDNLDPDYLKRLSRGSKANRQRFELGEWCDENKNALFVESMFRDHRVPKPKIAGLGQTPRQTLDMLARDGIDLDRVTVSVDPAVTADPKSDQSGIMVQGIAGTGEEAQVYILADETLRDRPDAVCQSVAQAYHDWGACRVVIEKNQGGLWLEATMRKAFPNVPLTYVTANATTGGKASRAEPVAAQYERGIVHHVGTFPELEAQMCDFGSPASRRKSPDRMDALVWGVTELLNLNGAKQAKPGMTLARRGARLR